MRPHLLQVSLLFLKWVTITSCNLTNLVCAGDYPNTITSTNPSSSAALQVQFSNILNGNWLSFCAARQVVNAMIADPFDANLLVHNGECLACLSCKAVLQC